MGLYFHPISGPRVGQPSTRMKLKNPLSRCSGLFLASSLASAFAQEVSIPDPGLNDASGTLQKPFDQLTEQDLLS